MCVYTYDCEKYSWIFVGKHRTHYKDITSITFTTKKNEDGFYKLLSFGQDRLMAEYDIGASAEEYLGVKILQRIDQTAVPLCGIEWPIPKGIESDVDMILVANNEVFNQNNKSFHSHA